MMVWHGHDVSVVSARLPGARAVQHGAVEGAMRWLASLSLDRFCGQVGC
jgi:hypothetical protein